MKTTKKIGVLPPKLMLTSLAAIAIALPMGGGTANAHPSSNSANTLIASADLTNLPVIDTVPVAPTISKTTVTPTVTVTTGPAPMALPVALPTIPAPDAAIADRGTSVSLDFVDATLVDVLKAMSIQSGYNIVASPDVVGKVTVSLSHVSLESALDFVTKTAGFEWVRRDNTYLVGTTKSLVAFEPAPISPSERITQTVEFSNCDADDLMASIRAAVPDVSVSLIKPGADTTTATGATGSTTTTTVREKGGILMVTGYAADVKKVQDFVALAENTFHPSVDESETSIYRIRYMFGPNLISILHSLVPKLTVITGPTQEYNTGAKINWTTSGQNSSINLSDRFPAPSAMAAGSKDTGPTDKTDPTMAAPTTLILSGSHEDISRALDVLSKVDVKPSQIMFTAKVLEVDDNAEKQLGVNWDFSGALASIAGVGSGTNFTFGSLATGSSTFTPGSSNLVEASVNALITDGNAKLLASPNVAALNGQRALVFIGDTINYVQSITQSTTGENVTTASIPVGVILGLTGRVSDDGYITVYLHPEVDSVTQWTTVPGGGQLPQLSTRLADTVIRVKNGDTIAIGGLTEDDFTYSDNKVPILGDLPILKNLFNNVTRNRERENVVFLIKTQIIDDHS